MNGGRTGTSKAAPGRGGGWLSPGSAGSATPSRAAARARDWSSRPPAAAAAPAARSDPAPARNERLLASAATEGGGAAGAEVAHGPAAPVRAGAAAGAGEAAGAGPWERQTRAARVATAT